VSLTDDLGGDLPQWGYTESVLLDGDHVICTPGGDKGAIAALDKRTGKVVWQTEEFTEPAHYSSVVTANINGVHQYVQRTEKAVVGVDAKNGKILWRTDFPGRVAVIPTPIVKSNDVYVTAGYGTGCKMVRIGPDFSVTEIYSNKVMKNHHGGALLVGDHLYGYSDGVGWTCQNFADGEEVWSERRALGKGAVTFADGMLYCLDEDKGTVALVKATPEGYEETGRFELDPQSEIRASRGKIWTHPVILNGRLYLRDQDLIYCYDVSGS
ncbi:MAG: PQQ-like beta-propeller repeat protein, partial [Pseudanabaenales cyanobacterium]|nr:PQQ-like beta-propeller repeat protein [Pseudanabaenales cyanobacterium]